MSFRNETRDLKDWYAEVIRRLDDLERQRPCDCVCNCCEGTIWLSTTLRENATTWTSRDGDTRTLDPVPAATNANGGLIWSALGGLPDPLRIDRIDEAHFTLLSAAPMAVDFEVTTWWDYPTGVEHYTYIRYRDTNRSGLRVLPPADFNSLPDRDYELKGNLDLYDGTDNINGTPSTIGLTGFTRGRIRAEIDLATGDAELFFATNGGPLVSQGTKTFPGHPYEFFDRYLFNNYGNDSDVGGAPSYPVPHLGTRCVMHSFTIEHDGATLAQLTETEINAARSDLEVGSSPADEIYPLNATRQMMGAFVFCPGGAPLMIRKFVSGTQDPDDLAVPKIFTDGPDLAQPAICWAAAETPNAINITNEEPKTWEPPQSAVIYGVADLVGFDDLTDGWPTDTWPLGDILL